jgi:hypothetical protein
MVTGSKPQGGLLQRNITLLQHCVPLSMLKVIHPYRSLISARLFKPPGHYYMILAKITDHLLQFCVSREEETRSPFFDYIVKQKG